MKTWENEIRYRVSRSSGSGGQHVNKVETRVELLFDVRNSDLLNTAERALIQERLGNRISQEGILRIVNQKSRSQLKNKTNALKKFRLLMEKALVPPPKRKKVKPLTANKEKRLSHKKQKSDKKKNRKKVIFNRGNDLSFFLV